MWNASKSTKLELEHTDQCPDAEESQRMQGKMQWKAELEYNAVLEIMQKQLKLGPYDPERN